MLEFELKKPENEKWGCCMLLQHPVFNNRYLVCQRAPGEREEPGSWGFVGGKVDQGETATEAVVREVREETGIIVQSYEYIGSYEEGEYTDFVFVCTSWSGSITLDPNECSAYEWVTLSDLKEQLVGSVVVPVFSYTQVTVKLFEEWRGRALL